ncbi:hypothetical protein CEXT_300061 [Caerostris extrusa]|uniref:Uncharacterized protein n=1 Tax=Caerostris extrusa TaxID=172846 RepID=A0AAV4MQV1_CAEEX|nr:hypothetical protein CEXT_300061 [Caerostris extrusa]
MNHRVLLFRTCCFYFEISFYPNSLTEPHVKESVIPSLWPYCDESLWLYFGCVLAVKNKDLLSVTKAPLRTGTGFFWRHLNPPETGGVMKFCKLFRIVFFFEKAGNTVAGRALADKTRNRRQTLRLQTVEATWILLLQLDSPIAPPPPWILTLLARAVAKIN